MSSPGESQSAHAAARIAPSRAMLFLAVLATWLIWGSTYLAVRYAVETIPPLLTAGSRILAAGLILFTYRYWRGFRPTWQHWRGAFVVGAFYFLGGHGLLYDAEQRVASGLAAVLIATEPVIISVLLILIGRERFSLWTFAGLLCGISGVAYLMGGQAMHAHSEILGLTEVVVGSVLWSIGVCYSPRSGLPDDAFASASITMLAGALLLLGAAALRGEFAAGRLNHVSLRSGFSLLYLVIFGSLMAFSAYIWLLSHVSPTLVSTHTFINPVIAVFLGWSLAGESLSPRLALSMVAILAAIGFIRLGTRRPQIYD